MQNLLKQQSRLWDYTINYKIGKGQYGEVFQVINKTDRQLYALKKMPVSGSQQKQKIQAFKQIKCLKLLNCPSIIEYKQSFLSMENIYIVMQYAAKGDFLNITRDRKRKEKFYTQNQLWTMFETIIKGVKYLHQKNIVHRDLKLENIFLTQDDKVKIGDLGMSKILFKTDQLISTRVGTPVYFAPEMIKNQLYSYPVDIWSMGCVFYALTMLQHPFQDASLQTLSYYIIDRQPKPIKGQYSPQLITFINSCLLKDASKRPNIFQLALTIKNRNSQSQRKTRISIFNLRQLTKMINSQANQSLHDQKINQNKFKSHKISSQSVIIQNPRKIYTSSDKRSNNYARNSRKSVDKRYLDDQMINSPESPRKSEQINRIIQNKKSSIQKNKQIPKDFQIWQDRSNIKSNGFILKLIQNNPFQAKAQQNYLLNLRPTFQSSTRRKLKRSAFR